MNSLAGNVSKKFDKYLCRILETSPILNIMHHFENKNYFFKILQ